MSYSVQIEVQFDWDEKHTQRFGGMVAGKAVANILKLLPTYCAEATSEEDLEIKQWFAVVDKHYRKGLCEINEFLALGQNYTREADSDPSMKGIFYTAWVDTEQLIHHLFAFRDAILSAQPDTKWWYEPESTDRDIINLIHSLNLVHELGGNLVRLFVE